VIALTDRLVLRYALYLGSLANLQGGRGGGYSSSKGDSPNRQVSITVRSVFRVFS
jgi:hypothetical protein